MSNTEVVNMFIVTGRTGHSLVAAKAMPFAVLEKVNSIYIFSETKGFEIPKCAYITVPEWIRKVKPSFLGKAIRFFFEPFQLLYFAVKLKPDFINGVYCLPKGLNSYIVSCMSGVRCVNSVIGSILEIETELPFKSIWKNINLWQLKGCDALTVKGETDRNYLIQSGVDQQKLFLFNGAIDTEKFTYCNSERHIDILFVGSFIELKGTDRIIRIVAKLKPEFPELKVVMIGDGQLLNEAKKLSEELRLNNTILFIGYEKNTLPYFQDSKILLMPSRSDSLPTSMLEAMATGCVTVISDVGNVTEAAADRINSRVIKDYMDIEDFTEAVRSLLNDEELRIRYALNARKTVEDKYSVGSQSILAQEIINYLKEN